MEHYEKMSKLKQPHSCSQRGDLNIFLNTFNKKIAAISEKINNNKTKRYEQNGLFWVKRGIIQHLLNGTS